MRMQISAKCSDLCFTQVIDSEGNAIYENDGYVPSGLGIGGGDYVEFTVDLTTGQLIGFKPLTKEKIQEILENNRQ